MLKSIFMVQPASNRVGSHFTIGWNFMPPVQVVAGAPWEGGSMAGIKGIVPSCRSQ
jgi:hypothetical protein